MEPSMEAMDALRETATEAKETLVGVQMCMHAIIKTLTDYGAEMSEASRRVEIAKLKGLASLVREVADSLNV